MKKNWITPALFAVCFTSANTWADYRYQLGLISESVDSKIITTNTITFIDPGLSPGGGLTVVPPISSIRFDTDEDLLGLNATVYLAPVDAGIGPLAEAGFLSKQTSMSVALQQREREQRLLIDNPTSPTMRVASEELGLDVGIRYVTPDTSTILGFNAGYDKIESSGSGTEYSDADARSWSAVVGYYVTENGAITVDYGKQYRRMNGTTVVLSDNETTLTEQGVAYRQVFAIFERQFLTLNLRASKAEIDSGLPWEVDSKSAGLAYYPIPTLSLAYSLTRTDAQSGTEPTSHDLQLGYFFSESLSLTVSARHLDHKERLNNSLAPIVSVATIDTETDSLAVGLQYRY